MTLFIGGNDYCLNICYNDEQDRVVNNAEYDLVKTLRYLRDNLPRTMVNVLIPPNVITILFSMRGKPQECNSLHYIECPCVFSFNQQKNLKRSLNTIKKWKARVKEVTSRAEFLEKPVSSSSQDFLLLPNFLFISFPGLYCKFDAIHR